MKSSLIIQSRDNPQFKRWLSLVEKPRIARQQGVTLLEGVHLCSTYLAQCGQPIRVILTENTLLNREAEDLLKGINVDVIRLHGALAKTLSQVETGILLWFEVPILEKPLPEKISTDCLILDNLQDPGNVGTILRSAAAAKIDHVVALTGTASIWSPKVLRAGMGAHFYLQVWETSWCEIQSRLALPLYATSPYAVDTIYQTNLRDPCAWVFGHEGQGVCREILQSAKTLSIPQPGGIESLNVAAAASICMFEKLRQIITVQQTKR